MTAGTTVSDFLASVGLLPADGTAPEIALDIDTFVRAAVLFVLGSILYNLPVFLQRIKLTILGVAYFVFCNDKSWKKPQDPGAIFQPILSNPSNKANVEKKTIIFVRHGESTWNDTFNKGHHRSALVFAIGFIPGLIKAFTYETYLILSGRVDSWFYDSPISHLGLDQVDKLAKFLSADNSAKLTKEEAEFVSILRGDPGAPSSTILCSSLRRALSTVACSFRERLARNPSDKILVVPSLQEISRNPDTLSITPVHQTVTASFIDRTSKVCDFQAIYSKQTDMSLHIGNKPINTNGLKRMNEFCDYVMTNVEEENVIVGGHSIWFRSFFRTYLPYTVDHVSKKRKVVNAGCVAFTLLKATTGQGDKYMIDPRSIKVIYGGF